MKSKIVIFALFFSSACLADPFLDKIIAEDNARDECKRMVHDQYVQNMSTILELKRQVAELKTQLDHIEGQKPKKVSK